MAREARVVLPGEPHHITQRGNDRCDVFFAPSDYRLYLELLLKACREYDVGVNAYCLMNNHVHFVMTPSTESALANTLGQVSASYAFCVNERYGRSGHLWQGRFYSCPLDEDHFWQTVRYVECNPVRAAMAQDAWAYRWSSAAAHVARSGVSRLLDLEAWRNRMPPEEWKQVLAEWQAPAEVENIRIHTRSGRPLGGKTFVKRVEARLGRPVCVRPPGRPRKGAAKE